jgi:class 3 adenylate cyclase/tetratricopeptide (TPR) repeat protein
VPICPECGQQNPEQARFCNACAALLAPAPGPERRKLATVLFCDISGSTAMGERVDAESVRDLMFRYFHEMRSAIEAHGGTVEKFIGDAVMAVFGVPIAHEDDALRAVRAAAEMRERLATLNDELERRFGTRLALRIGINSGEVVAGDSTSRQTIVTGDVVNVAARLEQAAPAGEILLGEGTQRLVRGAVTVEALERLELKGKTAAVPAYRLLDVGAGTRAPAHRLTAAMVGRQTELGMLMSAFGRAFEQRSCEFVVLAGQAGVGKSRLADEFLGFLGSEARVLSGRCLSYGEGITYWPLAEAVREAAGIRDEDTRGRARRKVAALVAGQARDTIIADRICQAIGLAEGAAPPEEIAWAAGRLFETLARRRPLVVLFDDLHWAEPTFLDLLDQLNASLRNAPVLLLGVARPELLERRADWPAVVRIEPLGEDDSNHLIENLLGHAGLADDARARIVEAAGGNPLFVEELLAMLIDDGLLRHDNETWVAVGDLSAVRIPLTIGALLGARLDRLERGERATVERGSIEGQTFHRSAVVALSDEQSGPQAAAHLRTLTRREFVRPAPAAFAADAAFRFRHILIREAAYAGTAKKLRAELHERFAVWLERISGERVREFEEILGHHLERAYRYREELGPIDDAARELGARAAARLTAAGQRALGRADVPAANNLLGRAASLCATTDPLRLRVLPDLGVALMLSGDLTRADEVLSEAIDAAAAAGDEALQARALVERTLLRSLTDPTGEVETIRRVSAFAIPVLEEVSDHQALAKAWKMLALTHILELQYDALRGKLEHALEHARQADDAREQAEIVFWMGMAIASGPTPVDEGIARFEEVVAGADGPIADALRLTILAGLNSMRGQFEEARRLADGARAIYEALGLELWVAGMANCWGPIELLAGDPVAAERELRKGYEGLERIGEKAYLSTVAGYLAEALYQQARYEEAARFAGISRETAGADDLVSQILWRTTDAKVLARQGAFDEAEAVARDALRLVVPTDATATHADTLLGLAEVLRLAGRRNEALPLVEEALDLYEQKGVLPSVERTRALLAGELSSEAAR